jgi:hypothetical protein
VTLTRLPDSVRCHILWQILSHPPRRPSYLGARAPSREAASLWIFLCADVASFPSQTSYRDSDRSPRSTLPPTYQTPLARAGARP